MHDLASGTVALEFDDLDGVERALKTRNVACVLCEPALTNIGMVLPQPGLHNALRALTRKHGTLLAIDETHTISTGLGGYSRVCGLEPDFFVAGKAIAGGFPCAVYGFTAELRERMLGVLAQKAPGHSGLGTTLSANAMAIAALNATLNEVMTPSSYTHMIDHAAMLEDALEEALRVERPAGARHAHRRASRAHVQGRAAAQRALRRPPGSTRSSRSRCGSFSPTAAC